MAAIALAVAAGGAIKSGKTTVLMTGAEALEGMKKAGAAPRSTSPCDNQWLRVPNSWQTFHRMFAPGNAQPAAITTLFQSIRLSFFAGSRR
jgi:hypothetical protein